LRGPKALHGFVQPFGKLLDLDPATSTRSHLRWARGMVEVASRDLIPPFLWFELTDNKGFMSVFIFCASGFVIGGT
jgi:hypothetical protein